MTALANMPERLQFLVHTACTSEISTAEVRELEAMLLADADARRFYSAYCQMHAELLFLTGEKRATEMAKEAICERQSPSSTYTFLNATADGASVLFSQSWPLAYIAATVILGVGLLLGAIIPAFHPQEIASGKKGTGSLLQNGPEGTPLPSPLFPLHSVVGQITGMVDCHWADPGTATIDRAYVPMGRKYALASGLMEITYDSGAKVILQGPVTYEVDSRTGGFLSVGKLTARVNKKAEGGGRKAEKSNPQSLIPNPSLPTAHYPLFTVSTPTATVTDLGTEFGVEVVPNRLTQVYVSQGRVLLRPSAGDSTQEVTLTKGESSQVDVQGMMTRHSESETASVAGTFVRQLPRQIRNRFVSLTDLVAGGNGFGDRSFWGINAQDASVMPVPGDGTRFTSSGKYERYGGLPQIDGVFIPDGSTGPVQLDSAGHTFALPKTCGQACEWSIWAYKDYRWAEPSRVKPIGGRDAKLSSMLLLHANAGITFDLAAVRASARDCNATRFQSVVQNCQWNVERLDPSVVLTADVWVFVDGQLRFTRTKLCKNDGPVEVDIPLEPKNRFLTLVSTDGGNDIDYDNTCFLNPRVYLEAVP